MRLELGEVPSLGFEKEGALLSIFVYIHTLMCLDSICADNLNLDFTDEEKRPFLDRSVIFFNPLPEPLFGV